MSALSALLEDFGGLVAADARATGATSVLANDLEAERLEAFEQGYKAGWDDSAKANSEDQDRIGSALAQNLLDLGFTYNEATAQLTNALVPLLQKMTDVLLPEIARGTLSLHIVEQLDQIARNAMDGGVEICIAPDSVSAVSHLEERDFGFPVRVTGDPSLGEGQAALRFAGTEQEIDVQAALESVRTLVAGFAHEAQKEVVNG